MDWLTDEYIEYEMWLTEYSLAYDFLDDCDERVVEFEPTRSLEVEADKIRKANGFKPLFDYDETTDFDGWYNFLARITKNKLLEFYFETENTEEEYGAYRLNLTDEQKKMLFEKIVSIASEYFSITGTDNGFIRG